MINASYINILYLVYVVVDIKIFDLFITPILKTIIHFFSLSLDTVYLMTYKLYFVLIFFDGPTFDFHSDETCIIVENNG